jgi:hypothetical protein
MNNSLSEYGQLPERVVGYITFKSGRVLDISAM